MSECIYWYKSVDRDGYGQMWVGGKLRKAHRYAYCTAHKVPYESIRGLLVRHKCDNPTCINPDHLELGTHLDNMRDRSVPKRTASGVKHGGAVLTESDVLSIRKRYIKGSREHSLTAIAKDYGIAFQTVSKIINRQQWQHI